MCRCQVESGAGSILPTETGFFSYKQQHDNWRLACQVKVKENIEMHIPEEVLGIKKWECEVVSNRNISTFLKEFVVKLPEGENLKFKSGGYIQIDVPAIDVDFKTFDIDEKYKADWERMKMFDLKMHNPEATYRAYSMANSPAEGNIIMLNIRIATPPFDKAIGGFANVNPGICSSYIFSRKPGDKVSISGPYGEFFLRDTNNEMMFIGGGAGMAPCVHTSSTSSTRCTPIVKLPSGTAHVLCKKLLTWTSSTRFKKRTRTSTGHWLSTDRIPWLTQLEWLTNRALFIK